MPWPSRFWFAAATALAAGAAACATRGDAGGGAGSNAPASLVAKTPLSAGADEGPSEVASSYAELVRGAAAHEGEPDPRCVLARAQGGLRWLGKSTPAVRPLPSPATELDAALRKDITVNVLTPFGRYGSAPGALTLASFTYAPPTREAVALVLTDHGIALRGSEATVPPRDALSANEATRALGALQDTTVFVSAEATVGADALAFLLSALQNERAAVALAVNLAPDVRLPDTAAHPVADTCPQGLSDTAEPEGALEVAQLAAVLTELRARAADCLASADPRGAAGGHMSLLLRVAATGALAEACIDRDEIGDARLRACILDKARALRFPAPSPRGSVDLSLPLALVSAHAPAARLLCADRAD